MLERITPVILTLNEEANIGRTLDRLRWANRIVVIDSFSTDRTSAIAALYPQVQFVQRDFDTLANQWNFGLEQVSSEWMLALDADYVLSSEIVEEMKSLRPADGVGAYRAHFQYHVFGKPLRGTLYPPKPVLLRRGLARFIQDGHTQRAVVHGSIADLTSPIAHDDRKPIGAFLRNQDHYMTMEAQKIQQTPFAQLGWSGRIRKLIVVAPFAAFLFTLLVRGTILDGRRGLHYAFQRMLAESILSLKLLERSSQQSAVSSQ